MNHLKFKGISSSSYIERVIASFMSKFCKFRNFFCKSANISSVIKDRIKIFDDLILTYISTTKFEYLLCTSFYH